MAPLRDGGLVIGDNARLEAILHPSRRLDTLSRGSGRWTTIHGEHRRVNASPTILLCELDLGLFTQMREGPICPSHAMIVRWTTERLWVGVRRIHDLRNTTLGRPK